MDSSKAVSIRTPSVLTSKFHLYLNYLSESKAKQRKLFVVPPIGHNHERSNELLLHVHQVQHRLAVSQTNYYSRSIELHRKHERAHRQNRPPLLSKPSHRFLRKNVPKLPVEPGEVEAKSPSHHRDRLQRAFRKWLAVIIFSTLKQFLLQRRQVPTVSPEVSSAAPAEFGGAGVHPTLKLPLGFVIFTRINRRHKSAKIVKNFLYDSRKDSMQYYVHLYHRKVNRCQRVMREYSTIVLARTETILKWMDMRIHYYFNRYIDNEKMREAAAERERRRKALITVRLRGEAKWDRVKEKVKHLFTRMDKIGSSITKMTVHDEFKEYSESLRSAWRRKILDLSQEKRRLFLKHLAAHTATMNTKRCYYFVMYLFKIIYRIGMTLYSRV